MCIKHAFKFDRSMLEYTERMKGYTTRKLDETFCLHGQSLPAGQSGEESSGKRPLTSLGLYRGLQQQSALQLGAQELGHDSGQVCPRGRGTTDGSV